MQTQRKKSERSTQDIPPPWAPAGEADAPLRSILPRNPIRRPGESDGPALNARPRRAAAAGPASERSFGPALGPGRMAHGHLTTYGLTSLRIVTMDASGRDERQTLYDIQYYVNRGVTKASPRHRGNGT